MFVSQYMSCRLIRLGLGINDKPLHNTWDSIWVKDIDDKLKIQSVSQRVTMFYESSVSFLISSSVGRIASVSFGPSTCRGAVSANLVSLSANLVGFTGARVLGGRAGFEGFKLLLNRCG